MDTPELKTLFSHYKQVDVFESPKYKIILNQPICSTSCLYEEEDGMYNTKFRDLEKITYFYDFSSLATLQHHKIEANKFLILMARGDDKKSIGEKLEEWLTSGKQVTHIIRSTEEYGGNTHYSVWREYLNAEIYEVEKNE